MSLKQFVIVWGIFFAHSNFGGIFELIENNSLDELSELVSSDSYALAEKNNFELNPLQFAIEKGKIEAIKIILGFNEDRLAYDYLVKKIFGRKSIRIRKTCGKKCEFAKYSLKSFLLDRYTVSFKKFNFILHQFVDPVEVAYAIYFLIQENDLDSEVIVQLLSVEPQKLQKLLGLEKKLPKKDNKTIFLILGKTDKYQFVFPLLLMSIKSMAVAASPKKKKEVIRQSSFQDLKAKNIKSRDGLYCYELSESLSLKYITKINEGESVFVKNNE